jgi:hypothetical protein
MSSMHARVTGCQLLRSVLRLMLACIPGPLPGAAQQQQTETLVPLELPISEAAPPMAVPIDCVILIAGATGGVGKRVTSRLLAAGKHVRALVRDLDKGKAMLVSLYRLAARVCPRVPSAMHHPAQATSLALGRALGNWWRCSVSPGW